MAQKYIEGDVVMYDNKIMVVKEPRDGRHFELSCPKEGLVYDLVDIEEIKPVRLTPEILEKNRWKKPDGFDSYWLDKIGLLQEGDTWHSALGSTKIAITLGNIQYVHELQHLFFGLGINHEMEV